MRLSMVRWLFNLILVFSILLNFILFYLGYCYYKQLNLTRLEPWGLNYYPVAQKFNHTNKMRIVLFGDSRAYQWSTPLDQGQFAFINRGIGEQTSTQIINRYNEHVDPLHPDVLLVQMCVNDLKLLPLFPDRKEWIIENCKNNIVRLIREAKNKNVMVILTTIFPVGKPPFWRRLFWSDEIKVAIEEVNKFISAQKTGKVIVLDAARILKDGDGLLREDYSMDFMHLNERGYEVLNKEFKNILFNLIKKDE